MRSRKEKCASLPIYIRSFIRAILRTFCIMSASVFELLRAKNKAELDYSPIK